MNRSAFLILIAVSCSACDMLESPISSDPKSIVSADSGNHLLITGRWRNLGSEPSLVVPHINTVRIECDRNTRACKEFVAKVIRKSDDTLGDIRGTKLWLMVMDFQIQEWSSASLVAKAEPRAADVELRVSFRDEVVERISRETSARGADPGGEGKVEHWVLE